MTTANEPGRNRFTHVRRSLRQAAAAGLGLLALALIGGNLGNLSRALNGLLAVAALLSLAILQPGQKGRVPHRRFIPALALIALSLPLVARGEPVGLPGAALFFFALSLLAPDDDGMATALLLTALLFALHQTWVAYVPLLWHAEQWASLHFSRFVGVGLMLGPTALGTPLFVLFALFALSVSLPAGKRKGQALPLLAAWLVALLLAVAACLWLQPPLGSWLLTVWPDLPSITSPTPTPAPPATLTYLESPWLLFLLLWLVSALAGLGLSPRPLPLIMTGRPTRRVTVGLVLLALSALVLSLDPPSHPRRGAILVYDAGHLDWGRPAFGRYGAHSGGSFGLWPDYLAACGYEARIGPLSEENLEGAGAVVLLNLPHKLSDQERERLTHFVAQGGGLVIWGEHTAVDHIREPVNDLLAHLSVPIRLRFDSAVPVRQGWAEGLSLRPHPAVYGVHDPVDLVIAVGASLEIAPPANPIIVGRFGHSDAGNVNNPARNYVGDMRYNPGEQLGDLVLAAEARYGRGRIVVLGDTTPLGSVNLMTTMPFHARLLDWVTAGEPAGWNRLLRNGWLATLLLIGAGACLLQRPGRVALAGAAAVLGLTLALTAYVNDRQSAPPLPTGPIAWVDLSHQERFDRLLWEETSIGGLDYNLVRNGTLPLLLRDISAGALAPARLLVIIAPGDRFSAREVETIRRWVEGGGRLLVSVGWEESQASEPLLAAFGLQVGNIPLGPVEVERETGLVRFHEAWPVSAAGPAAQTLVAGYGYPLAVYQPWGAGGVVLLGDSECLLGGTLEGETSYQEGNILLLRDIIQHYLGLGPGGRP